MERHFEGRVRTRLLIRELACCSGDQALDIPSLQCACLYRGPARKNVGDFLTAGNKKELFRRGGR